MEIVLLILLLCIIVISIIVWTVIYLQGHGLLPKRPTIDTETITTDVSGTITSTKDKFTFEELANGATQTSDLTIQATGLTAGDWKGTFVVEVELDSTT